MLSRLVASERHLSLHKKGEASDLPFVPKFSKSPYHISLANETILRFISCVKSSTMAALNLKMEGPEGEKVTNGTFNILRDYLQPNSSMTQESAAKAILNLLPKDSPDSTEVRTFGEMCIEIVEQIHYSHPSQIKLAALLEYLGPSKQLSGRVSNFVRLP